MRIYWIAAFGVCLACGTPPPLFATSPTALPAVTAYDADPQHLWNRLHATLFVRPTAADPLAGLNRVDPLLWPESTHLLVGPYHARTLAVLDEFIDHTGESLVADPLRRALLQHDLWAMFDWSVGRYARVEKPAEREALQSRLAKVIGRLTLDDKPIDQLPDNYALALAARAYPPRYDADRPAQPFLPPNLFDAHGPWVCLGMGGNIIVTPAHTEADSGRSVFLAFLNLPGGRAATCDYLNRLASFPKPWLLNPKYGNGPQSEPEPARINPDTPQFPPGTQVALVRQMMGIDRRGRLRPTHLTQSLQLRVYRKIGPPPLRPGENRETPKDEQAFFEFRLQRADLLAGHGGGLRAVGPDEKDYLQFNAHSFDPIENDRNPDGSPVDDRVVTMKMCGACHPGPGVLSLQTYVREFTAHGTRPPGLSDYSAQFIGEGTVLLKKRQYDWGLLQGLLRQERPAALTPTRN